MILCATVAFLNESLIRDKIKALRFTPSAELIGIENNLGLTSKATTIFRATSPSLDSSIEFNEHCSSHDINTAVLGCYDDDRIFIYKVQTQELDGIIESTAAHELLHAVWYRLSNVEKSALINDLEKTYQENCDLLCDILAEYPEADFSSELYARVGTEVKNLPESLSTHYRQYFNDQTAVVDFYNSYVEVFTAINKKNDNLYAKIVSIKDDLEKLSSEYAVEYSNYISAVETFNNCAKTAGCFNEKTFTTRRKELLAAYNQLSIKYNLINQTIVSYNDAVEQYNNNILYGERLEQAINSNAEPAKI